MVAGLPIDQEEKQQAAETVVRECFWGDYQITPEDVISNLKQGDGDLARLIVSKIIDSASHPSALFRALMDRAVAEKVLESISVLPGSRRAKRLQLVRANLLGKPADLSEFSWNR